MMKRTSTKLIALSLLAATGLALTGCNNAGEGALSGGLLGAAGGVAIGSMTGNAGKGAVIGGVAGALGGAVLGDQNARNASSSGSNNAAHW